MTVNFFVFLSFSLSHAVGQEDCTVLVATVVLIQLCNFLSSGYSGPPACSCSPEQEQECSTQKLLLSGHKAKH